MPSPRLSIVIPVYNNWWLSARCLREIERLRTTCAFAFETIVVDNASSDETPTRIADFPWVRYIRHDENRNFAGACNAGAAAAQAPLTLLLNNDAYPLGDALTPLMRAFDRDEVVIAGGALFFEDGVTQSAGLVLLQNEHWHYFCRNLPPTLDGVTQSRQALAVCGAAMAMRTDWFLRNGGFDESFLNGFEDVDLCLRAREQSRTIAYVGEARFAHYEAASAGRFAHEAENERRFYERWSPDLVHLPRTKRGEVGAIGVQRGGSDPLLAAALDDLEQALGSFGHPMVRGAVAPWRLLDRRFRRTATLSWFTDEGSAPGITIAGGPDGATIRTRGAVSIEVSWLPCAAQQRLALLPVRPSLDPACAVIGIVGDDADVSAFASQHAGYATLQLTPAMLLGKGNTPLACVVHLGLTDASGFGNVLLLQAGIPAVVSACTELRKLFSSDVAIVAERHGVDDAIVALIADPALRGHYGKLVAADARRRFAPRRSAIRVVDLLCAARFGLERSA